MMDRDKLQAAVDSKWTPIHMRTKGEIWEYFLDKHKGDRQAAASDAARTLSGESGGKAYKNARRNFEERKGQMIGKKAGNTPKWHAFGEKLPPVGKKLPGDKITLTVKGTQYEKGGDRERSFTTTFKGPDAYSFANSPTYHSFFQQGFGYPDGVIERFDGGDSSALEVTSVT